MSEQREPPDELELKKRARRRLVGAVAFATFAAVVLPMVMDETPPPAGREIELRIPGQDQVTSSPLTTGKPAAAPTAHTPAPALPPLAAASAEVPASAKDVAAPAVPEPVARKPEPLPALAKPAVKAAPPAEVPPSPVASESARRAQAILDGHPAPTADAAGAYVILIGAYANAGNVKGLQLKLGQIGVKTFTEILESAQGRKTRLRAGPFASKDAAEKALEKMKRIGVGGVLAPKP
jgi:DedD protein